MTFGWQGFRFDHPDDWAPASVAGTFKEGYARISSARSVAAQVRWQECRGSPGLSSLLERYLGKLRKDAKRSGAAFETRIHENDGDLMYRWTGSGQGRGLVLYSQICSRVFILEVIGTRSDQLLPHLRSIRASFSSLSEGLLLWSTLGLGVRIPFEYPLSKHEFLAGKTQLTYSGPGLLIECTRWGFAEQVLAKYALADWSRASLDMPRARVFCEGAGVRLSKDNPLSRTEAIVSRQPGLNQIVTVKSTSRRNVAGPKWEWIA